MILTYNNRERAKERAESKPPSDLEVSVLVSLLEDIIPKDAEAIREVFQSLLDDYDNKLHFYNINKVWQGEVNYEIVSK